MTENMTPPHFAHLRDKFVTIVAFGDSTTAVNHWTLGGLNWVGLLSMSLYYAFPKGCTVINSGIGGNQIVHALERVDRDVLRFDPDITIVSFGANDCLNTTPERFRAGLREVVRRIRAGSESRIVLRTPNPLVDMFTGRELHEYPMGDGKAMRVDRAAFAQVICDVAREEQTLLVDHYSLWKKSMESECVGDLIMLMSNPQHPNHLGHRRLYHELAPTFGSLRNLFHEWERILRDQGQIP